MNSARAVIFGSYVNAWALSKALLKLNQPFVVCDRQNGLINASELVANPEDHLLFTNEEMLLRYLEMPGFKIFPKIARLELIDDKWKQFEFLQSIGERPIPSWPASGIPPSWPIYLKLKHSWWNGIRLPRGQLLSSASDVAQAFESFRFKSITPEMCFFQLPLAGSVRNNVSVSGFFDHCNQNRNCLVVTKKLWGCGLYTSEGTIVETIPDPTNLIERTRFILKELEFSGPFELEFFRDERSNEFYVLELNCRFWMQHGLFINHADNAVVRYVVDPTSSSLTPESPALRVIWIDTIGVLGSIVRGRIKFWDIVSLIVAKRGYKFDLNPGLTLSLQYMIRQLVRKLAKRWVEIPY